jgi:hypothetical protein
MYIHVHINFHIPCACTCTYTYTHTKIYSVYTDRYIQMKSGTCTNLKGKNEFKWLAFFQFNQIDNGMQTFGATWFSAPEEPCPGKSPWTLWTKIFRNRHVSFCDKIMKLLLQGMISVFMEDWHCAGCKWEAEGVNQFVMASWRIASQHLFLLLKHAKQLASRPFCRESKLYIGPYYWVLRPVWNCCCLKCPAPA